MNRSNVNAIFLDFAKTFNRFNHRMAWNKLIKLDITGKVGVFSWLLKRQAVLPNRVLSTEILIEHGVPQGTIFRLLLFIVTLSDIPSVTQIVSFPKYVDYTKIVQAVKESSDANLQKDIDSIYKWTEGNRMQFPAGKFQPLRYQLIGTQKS